MTDTSKVEQHAFQAEVEQVLGLVVNSLYTHKEVFLRELVSNASDALDQLSFRALTEPELLGGDRELAIDLVPDRAARTLTVRDNGIGMTHDELVRNLGTIAHSGTRKLLESLSGDRRRDLPLIGQFGVGFYSAFLVADRVEVVSRAAGSEAAYRWESAATGGFTVEPAARDARGTDVVLHLKEGEDDFLREWTLRELVRKYSDFVRHPIRLEVERQEPATEERDEHGEPKETRTVRKLEQVNTASALWTRPRAEVTQEQYDEFYRHLTHDWEAPLAQVHFKLEGVQEVTGLLFVPREAPFDLQASRRRGVRLHVRRVFIMDDCEELVPSYLRFVRGVVDSEDLPLNVSREFLQRDRVTSGLRKQVTRQVLGLLEELASEGPKADESPQGGEEPKADGEPAEGSSKAGSEPAPEPPRYERFWDRFGHVLAEGLAEDPEHRDRIAKLLRFRSSAGPGWTSLEEYVARMAEGQPEIYFLVAETRDAAAGSPHIEALRRRGYEVLFLTEPAEEWAVSVLGEFDGKRIVSAAAADVELPAEEGAKEETERRQEALAGLLGRMREALTGSVKDVRVSSRLTESPACLVQDAHMPSPKLARLLRQHKQDVPAERRVLEVNPSHPAVQRLDELAQDPARAERVKDLTLLLYDQALVAEGSPPSDPVRFARQVSDLLRDAAQREPA